MSIKTERVHTGEFLLSEANGQRSRANIVIAAGAGIVLAGTLLAAITTANAMMATPEGGNTGDGTVGTIAVTSTAVSGTYTLSITKAAAGAGSFDVIGPGDNVIGSGQVGEAFEAAGLGFSGQR